MTEKNTNYYRFEHGYEIKTTPEQDKLISAKFKEISENESYFFFGNNCATTVTRSLLAGGVNTLTGDFGMMIKSIPMLFPHTFVLAYLYNVSPTFIFDKLESSSSLGGRYVER